MDLAVGRLRVAGAGRELVTTWGPAGVVPRRCGRHRRRSGRTQARCPCLFEHIGTGFGSVKLPSGARRFGCDRLSPLGGSSGECAYDDLAVEQWFVGGALDVGTAENDLVCCSEGYH